VTREILFRLAGYFLKTTAVPPNWPDLARVEEICSVSTCICRAPEGWLDRWRHNQLGFFNTRAAALTLLPEERERFSLFAYRLLLLRFTQGGVEPFAMDPYPVEELPASFVSLGFDVVSRSVPSFFECSPLSCSGMAAEVAVNRFCLVETPAEAMALAERCAREEPEPGPYHVLEVLREPRV
jgi:hypothetical protein